MSRNLVVAFALLLGVLLLLPVGAIGQAIFNLTQIGGTPQSGGNVIDPTNNAIRVNAVAGSTVKITDGTNSATVKPPFLAASAADPALVVSVSPNNVVTVSVPSLLGLLLPQGSTTAGTSGGVAQLGPLMQGAVATAAPTYITGQTSPVSLTTGGLLRVSPVGTVTVQGTAASGAAKANNPVQVGGVFNTTQPTVTTGQAVEAQATQRGALIIATGAEAVTATANQGAPGLLARPWPHLLTDGVNGAVAVTPPFGSASAASPALVVSVSPTSSFPATTTKGIQVQTAIQTQPRVDSGRTNVIFTADAVAPASSETLVTVSTNVGGTVTSSLTARTVSAGKTFRVQSITASMIDSSTVANNIAIHLRDNVAGVCTATSALVFALLLGTSGAGTIAANDGWSGLSVAIPDGLEFSAGNSICLSAIGSATTATMSITVVGFEY